MPHQYHINLKGGFYEYAKITMHRNHRGIHALFGDGVARISWSIWSITSTVWDQRNFAVCSTSVTCDKNLYSRRYIFCKHKTTFFGFVGAKRMGRRRGYSRYNCSKRKKVCNSRQYLKQGKQVDYIHNLPVFCYLGFFSTINVQKKNNGRRLIIGIA